MTRPKPKFRRDIAWPLIMAATITWCSGMAAAVPAVDGLEVDKIGHFALYGALATAIARIPELARWPLIRLWWGLVLASAYGLGDEFRQSLTDGVRTCDWHDWAADTAGATLAVSLYMYWPWYRRLMETPVWQKRSKPKATDSQTEMATKNTKNAKTNTDD